MNWHPVVSVVLPQFQIATSGELYAEAIV